MEICLRHRYHGAFSANLALTTLDHELRRARTAGAEFVKSDEEAMKTLKCGGRYMTCTRSEM